MILCRPGRCNADQHLFISCPPPFFPSVPPARRPLIQPRVFPPLIYRRLSVINRPLVIHHLQLFIELLAAHRPTSICPSSSFPSVLIILAPICPFNTPSLASSYIPPSIRRVHLSPVNHPLIYPSACSLLHPRRARLSPRQSPTGHRLQQFTHPTVLMQSSQQLRSIHPLICLSINHPPSELQLIYSHMNIYRFNASPTELSLIDKPRPLCRRLFAPINTA